MRVKLTEWAKLNGVHPKTAYRWYREGTMPYPTTKIGPRTIVVDVPDDTPSENEICIYTRVSSHDQKEDLDRQVSRLLEHAAVRLVYTQSDEISVLITSWKDGAFNPKPELPFGGVEAKLVSLSASIASTAFNWYGDTLGWSKANFDSRVFTFPGTEEGRELVSKYFLWRHRDAVKNSVSMAASAHFSHKELHQKSVSDRLTLLQQKGVDWEDAYRAPFKYGTYLYPVVVKHMSEDGEVYYRRNWDTSSPKTSANVRVHIPSFPAVDTSTS